LLIIKTFFRIISADIEGRWKMLHYYTKDFFAPVIVTPYLSISNVLTIYIVSDRLDTLTKCTVKIHVYNWTSLTPVFTKSFNDITVVSIRIIYIINIYIYINLYILIFI